MVPPGHEPEERLRGQDEVEIVGQARRESDGPHRLERIDGVRRAHAIELDTIDREALVAGDGQLDHGNAVRRCRDRPPGLVRRLAGRHEQDALETQRLGGFLGDRQVGHVDRIERAPEDPDRTGHDRAGPPVTCAPRVAPPIRAPSRRSGRCRPPRSRPGAARVDAELRQVALEALGQFLDVEVGLCGDPLDPAAAHAEGAVAIELDAEAVAHRLDAVDDDARRLWRFGQLGCVGEERGDPRPERVETLAARGRDRDGLDAFPFPSSPERRPGLGRGRQVDLVERDQHGLVEESRIVRAKLLADHVVVPSRVTGRTVDDVDEDPRPLDVAQEGMAESGPAARTLDEPGYVGDRRSPFVVLAEVHDPEVRFERGEGIVRDLGHGRRDGGEDRGLARVRQSDEPDVGDQSELESEPALGARLTLLRMLRRLVGRGLEVRVAEPAATAAGDHRTLADRDQVRDERAGLVVVDRRAGRNVEDQVVAGPTVPSRLRAAATRGRAEVMSMIEVTQGRLAGVDPKVDRSSTTAVTAVGAAARNMRLLSEGRGPVTTIAGADPDLHAVEEHHRHSRTARRHGRRG